MINQGDGGTDKAKQSVIHGSNAECREVRFVVGGKCGGATGEPGSQQRSRVTEWWGIQTTVFAGWDFSQGRTSKAGQTLKCKSF